MGKKMLKRLFIHPSEPHPSLLRRNFYWTHAGLEGETSSATVPGLCNINKNFVDLQYI